MHDWTEWVNLAATLLLLAPLSQILAQWWKQKNWPPGLNAAFAVVVCLAVGVAQTWVAGSVLHLIGAWGTLTATDIMTWAGAVFVAAQIEYHTYFKWTKFMDKLAGWPGGAGT